MKRLLLLCTALWSSGAAFADVNAWSEVSHATAGALMAGAVTWGSNYYWPEHRALIGFGAGTLGGAIGELVDRNQPGGKFSFADFASNAAGAAIGAFVTDRYFLAPVVQRTAGQSYVGVMARVRF